MEFRITFDGKSMIKKIGNIADKIENLKPVFSQFTQYMREEIQKRFDAEGPGWPPRKKPKASTLHDHIKSRAESTLRSKLKRDITKAKQKRLKKILANTVGTTVYLAPQRVEKMNKSIETKTEKLKALNAIVQGKSAADAKLTQKQLTSLKNRLNRQEEKSSKTLGRLASSISASVTKYSVTMFSRADFSGVQNDGGTVGKNAVLPARPFMYLTSEQIEKFGVFLEEHLSKVVDKST